ncbi:MAG: response regulator [Candidatus Nanopelagicales bacterium]
MSAGTRVLLVDDDEFTRFLLVRALASFGYDEAVACDGAPAAVVAAETLRPHVAILDLDLGPGPSGIDLAHALRRKQPDLAIILLTSFEDPRLLVGSATLPSGTIYLTKRAVGNDEVLPRAMETVLASPCADTNARIGKGMATPLSLSDNQVDIMRLVAEGHSNAEIGRRLHLTERGVAKAVSRLVKQLGLESGADGNVRVLITQAYFQYSGQTHPR